MGGSAESEGACQLLHRVVSKNLILTAVDLVVGDQLDLMPQTVRSGSCRDDWPIAIARVRRAFDNPLPTADSVCSMQLSDFQAGVEALGVGGFCYFLADAHSASRFFYRNTKKNQPPPPEIIQPQYLFDFDLIARWHFYKHEHQPLLLPCFL
jgi:hypothetical protein